MTDTPKLLPARTYQATTADTFLASAPTRGPWHPDHQHAGHFSAQLIVGDKEVARFTVLLQRETDVVLPGTLADPALPLAFPGTDESMPAVFPFSGRHVGCADLVETRVAHSTFFGGPCAVWFRLRQPLLEGEAPSAYQRVAVAADSGNGKSAALDFSRYSFVNFDLTINLLRRPRGEWIGLDARTHLEPMGSGMAESALYNVQGLIGRATQSLMPRARG